MVEMSGYTTYSDRELVGFVREGDHAAFAEIYDRYNLALLNHAYKKLRSREEARDIVQEAFMAVWLKREVLDPQGNLSGYLYVSLRNLILNHFAHRQVREKYILSMQQFAAEWNVPADQLIRERQLAEAIGTEVEALPARMRQVFKLSRREQLDHKEIASRLRISEQTVASHITHALKILRTKLTMFIHLFFF